MIQPILLSLLSGVLFVLSFAPWDLGWLQWIAFIPLFYATTQTRKTFFIGFITQFVICLGGFYWIAYAVQRYGGLPEWVSILLLLAFCCTGQLQLPVYLWLRERFRTKSYFKDHPFLWPLAGALIYVGLDSLSPKLFSDTAGNAFYKLRWTRQLVELGGPFLLTFASLFVNEGLFQAMKRKNLRHLAAPVLVFIAIQLFGMVRLNQIENHLEVARKGPALNIAVIQANIGDYLKVASEHGSVAASREVIDTYLSMSKEASETEPKPDLIVWPETAYPALFGKALSMMDTEMEYKIKEFAHAFPGTLAFGGYDQDLIHQDFNSMFFVKGTAAEPKIDVYHKAILLQFGETLPGVEYFPEMKTWFPMMGFFGQGPGAQVYSIQKASSQDSFLIAPSICYEALFPPHSFAGSALKSDVLLNITNDSWFGEKGEPYLHLALSTYRSIETREHMVRSTNTGFSVVVDPTGELTQQTGLFKAEVLKTAIPKRIDVARVPGWIHSAFLRLSQLFTALIVLYYFYVWRKKTA